MAYKDKSEAIKYNNEFNKQKYDRISLLVPKGKKEIIKASADNSGESVNSFINRAVDMLIASGGSNGFIQTKDDQELISCFISHTELEKITAYLSDGETVGDYVRAAIIDKLKADTAAQQ